MLTFLSPTRTLALKREESKCNYVSITSKLIYIKVFGGYG